MIILDMGQSRTEELAFRPLVAWRLCSSDGLMKIWAIATIYGVVGVESTLQLYFFGTILQLIQKSSIFCSFSKYQPTWNYRSNIIHSTKY
ncbi:hypothetical protein ABKN59_011870, partial [Abortiporus biennis]